MRLMVARKDRTLIALSDHLGMQTEQISTMLKPGKYIIVLALVEGSTAKYKLDFNAQPKTLNQPNVAFALNASGSQMWF